MQQVDTKLVQVLCKALESSLAPTMIEPIKDESAHNWNHDKLVCVLGFKGPSFSGSLILGCEIPFLKATCPCIPPDLPSAEISGFINDWIGELSNLVIGRFKNFLAVHKIEFTINPPSVMEGTETIFQRFSERYDSSRSWFESEEGDRVSMMLTCEQEGFQLSDFSQANDQEHLDAGSGVLTLENFDPNQNANTIMKSEGVVPKGFYESCKVISETDIEESDLDNFEDEQFGKVDESINSTELETALSADDDLTEKSSASIEPAKKKVLETNEEIKPKLSMGSFPLRSAAVDNRQRIVLSFQDSVSFSLNIAELYLNGTRQFEIQGHTLSIENHAGSYVVMLDGLELNLKQSA